MSYASYKALLDEREKLKERVKELNLALLAAYIRLPLRQFNVSFVIRSTGTYDGDDISESHISDPLSAIVFANTPNMAREYLLVEDISTMDAVSEAEAEIKDLLKPEIEALRALVEEGGDLKEGPLVPAISFAHKIEIKAVVDDGLADEALFVDGGLEIKKHEAAYHADQEKEAVAT